MIIFDLINSIFKCFFWFDFFCFKSVIDTKRIQIIFKGCDNWWIGGGGGDPFQMIIFDLIKNPFKCWIRFKFWCFKDVVNTKLIKIIFKGCSNLVIRNCDRSLTDISLITSVSSEIHGVFELRATIYSSVCFDFWCCCPMKIINSSSGCSKSWSYLSNLAWSLASNQSSEDKVSEVRVKILFSMCSDENLFGYIGCSNLSSINSLYGCSKLWLDQEIFSCNFLSDLYSEDGCSYVICLDKIF